MPVQIDRVGESPPVLRFRLIDPLDRVDLALLNAEISATESEGEPLSILVDTNGYDPISAVRRYLSSPAGSPLPNLPILKGVRIALMGGGPVVDLIVRLAGLLAEQPPILALKAFSDESEALGWLATGTPPKQRS